MKSKNLFWQLYPVNVVIAVMSIAAAIAFSLISFKAVLEKQIEEELKDTAVIASSIFPDRASISDRRAAGKAIADLGKRTSKRLTLIDAKGRVVSDSEEDPAKMDDHSTRPEVKDALSGKTGVSIRPSPTKHITMIYVAEPLAGAGEVFGVMRVATPLETMSRIFRPILLGMTIAGVVIAVLVALATLAVSRRLAKPFEEIKAGAEKFSQGDLSYRLKVDGPDEVRSLATVMNDMAKELDLRVTRLAELENIRKDFVANVSHELKTPVTSIQGFAETMMDDPAKDAALAKKHLGIIASQAARLNSIIDDLLNLSKLEQETDAGISASFESAKVGGLIESAISVCSSKASEMSVKLEASCEQGLSANVRKNLVEGAIVNLVDNAIKYSDAGGTVRIAAVGAGGCVSISVTDEGCGIPPEHLPRIFERFYRVDRGRSREMGGTGLGLAIVKHVAKLHGGSVSVESEIGKGSKFTITIPASLHRG